ncbi:MAG: hypothetical protein AAGC85_14310 [Bacteroidota bacterium]
MERVLSLKLTCFFLWIFLVSCTSFKETSTSIKGNFTNLCEIKLNSGINSIVLGEYSFREIEGVLGKGVKSKEKFKSGTVENVFPNTAHSLSYPDLGLSFSTTTQGRLNFSRIADGLTLTKDSHCKTKEGLGIGSTFKELQSVLGKKLSLTKVTFKEGDYTMVSYTSPEGNRVYTIFKCYGHKSESEFVVEEIIMIG